MLALQFWWHRSRLAQVVHYRLFNCPMGYGSRTRRRRTLMAHHEPTTPCENAVGMGTRTALSISLVNSGWGNVHHGCIQSSSLHGDRGFAVRQRLPVARSAGSRDFAV